MKYSNKRIHAVELCIDKDRLFKYAPSGATHWGIMDKKKTAGELARNALMSDSYKYAPVQDIGKGIAENAKYIENLKEAVDRGIKQYEGDFFVTVLTKRERLLSNVIRFYYIPRQSCPTPNYDQSVYKYHRDKEEIEYIWTVPDPETCQVYLDNALQVAPEEKDLLRMIISFANGSLTDYCQELNGEKYQSLELEKKTITV